MTFGSRLVRARKAAGYNQRQFADALGITPTRLNYWENDKREPDLAMLAAMCRLLGVSADELIDSGSGASLSDEALTFARRYEALDAHGKHVVSLLLEAEAESAVKATELPSAPVHQPTRIIPLFLSSAAAGLASPVMGEDFEPFEIPEDAEGDFAVRISGNSMAPYIDDGSVVRVLKTKTIRPGDVGMFFVDGDMLCKQYWPRPDGSVWLLSLNRDRADADHYLDGSGSRSVVCFGRVIMDERPPYPEFI